MIGRSAPQPDEATLEPKGFDDFDLRLGDLMRGERATLGKSLLDVQRELKIKANYIAAIENADPTAFETQGFVAGYVRSYARYLGMDPEWAYQKFCQEGHFQVPHGMSPAASIQRKELPRASGKIDPLANPSTPFAPGPAAVWSRIEPGALGSLAVLATLIVGIGYGGWYMLREVQRVQFAPIEQSPVVVSDLGAGGPASATATSEQVGALAANPTALDRLYHPDPLEVPVMVARDGPIATINPNDVGTLASAAATAEVPAPEVSATDAAVAAALGLEATPQPEVFEADPGKIVLFAVRPAWVRVQSAEGTVLFEKILDKGESYTLPQLAEVPTMRSGNAGGLYLQMNGETFGPVGADGEVVKNVAMSIDNLSETYSVADMTSDSDLADVVNVAQNTPNP